MESLLILIPISVVLLGAATALFIWAVKRKQFEDLDLHALDILKDQSPIKKRSQPCKR